MPKIKTNLGNTFESVSGELETTSTTTGSGRPVATAQNPQERVQILPSIINVAVPSPQHSPILGQLPLSQIV